MDIAKSETTLERHGHLSMDLLLAIVARDLYTSKMVVFRLAPVKLILRSEAAGCIFEKIKYKKIGRLGFRILLAVIASNESSQ